MKGTSIIRDMESAQKNNILSAIVSSELNELFPYLEPLYLQIGDIIYEPNQHMEHAYFPVSSIISLQYIMDTGACAEAAEVGSEGMLGLPILLGGNITTNTAIVQTAGLAYKLNHRILKKVFENRDSLHNILLRYTQAIMTQMFQTAACNRHHSIEQQLCRWLLLTSDRIPSGEFLMTQESVANMLGVRRESVTEAAGTLKSNGCIDYRRGHISVLDREKLEGNACECYQVVKNEFSRLMYSVN